MKKSELLGKAYEQVDNIVEAGRKRNIEIQNLNGILWDLDNRGLTVQRLAKYREYAAKIETQIAIEQEAVEWLVGAADDIEEEMDNPTCEACGEKESVRTAIDDEGPHQCVGEV